MVALETHRWGSGDRRILLLHGITSNARGWWRLGGDLAAAGWAVTAVDLRGHGGSPAGGDYAMTSYAADVLAAGSDWDAVIGHSLGGAVAVVAHGMDPAFTRALVLQDPALVMGTTVRTEVAGWLLEPFGHPLTPEAVAEANPGWHPEDVGIKAEALVESSPEVVTRTIDDNWPWQFIEATAAVTVPTVILASDPAAGGIVPITIGEWFADQNDLIDFRVLEGAGHSVHREIDHYAVYFDEVQRVLALVTERAG
jgi:pimeloyl-ACP methyl ester carboxylesterase